MSQLPVVEVVLKVVVDSWGGSYRHGWGGGGIHIGMPHSYSLVALHLVIDTHRHNHTLPITLSLKKSCINFQSMHVHKHLL